MKMRKMAISATALVCMALGFLLAQVWDDVSIAQTPESSVGKETLVKTQSAFVAVAKAARPAVVTIVAERKPVQNAVRRPNQDMPQWFRDFFGEEGFTPQVPQRQRGEGSGFIINSDGYILTNDHVVGGADTVTVTLHDGREFKGKVSRDYRSDLALIKIDAKGLPTLKFADSDKVEPGQWAIAIGSPFGYDDTLTVGVISALARERAVSGANLSGQINSRFYPNLLQTDAAINPGNSGGPLLDIEGRVIGINTLIESPVRAFTGIGYAIPANVARDIAEKLMKHGKVTRGFLGVVPEDLTEAQKLRLRLKEGGVRISEVSANTPAEKAGLEPGDIVVKIDGRPVASAFAFRDMIGKLSPGDTIALIVLRDQKELRLTAKLDEAPDPEAPTGGEPKSKSEDSLLGLRVETLDSQLRSQMRLPSGTEGVVVTDIDGSSAAADAGVTVGTVIEKVNGRRVRNAEDYAAAIKGLKSGDWVELVVRRGDSSKLIEFKVD